MSWLVRFWFHVVLGREPNVMTRSDSRAFEEHFEREIAAARFFGVAPEHYAHHQAMLDQIRAYRMDGVLP